MKKLFSGKVGRIPAAALVISLLAVIAAGGVVAAASGYVLWEGTSNITVTEPITLYCGPDIDHCDTEIGLNDPMGSLVNLYPGGCKDTCFTITSASPFDLLIKAEVTTSNDSAMEVTFSNPAILTDGVLVNSSLAPVTVLRTVCVNGSAEEGIYTVVTKFTRESPP